MQADLLLLVHGEVTDPSVDFFDREKVFIEQKLKPIMEQVPELRIVMEHITTKDAADFVHEGPHNLAASITPQHMLLNRNALFLVRSFNNASISNTCSNSTIFSIGLYSNTCCKRLQTSTETGHQHSSLC